MEAEQRVGQEPERIQLLGRLDAKQLLPGETRYQASLPLAAEGPGDELGAVPVGGLTGEVAKA